VIIFPPIVKLLYTTTSVALFKQRVCVRLLPLDLGGKIKMSLVSISLSAVRNDNEIRGFKVLDTENKLSIC